MSRKSQRRHDPTPTPPPTRSRRGAAIATISAAATSPSKVRVKIEDAGRGRNDASGDKANGPPGEGDGEEEEVMTDEKVAELWGEFAGDHYEIVDQLPLELHRNSRLLRELDEESLLQQERLEQKIREYVAWRLLLVRKAVGTLAEKGQGEMVDGDREVEGVNEEEAAASGGDVGHAEEVVGDTAATVASGSGTSTAATTTEHVETSADTGTTTEATLAAEGTNGTSSAGEPSADGHTATDTDARPTSLEAAEELPRAEGARPPAEEEEHDDTAAELAMVEAQTIDLDPETEARGQDADGEVDADGEMDAEGEEDADGEEDAEGEEDDGDGEADLAAGPTAAVTTSGNAEPAPAEEQEPPDAPSSNGPSAATGPPEATSISDPEPPAPPPPRPSLGDIASLINELVRNREEKVAIAVGAYNTIDRHIRALDSALSSQIPPPVPSEPPEQPPVTPLPPARKGKKRKSEPAASEPPPPAAGALPPGIEADPNEPRYCYCNQVSYGEMVGCDNEDCPHEWFHLSCLGLTAPPTGDWMCDTCKPAGSAAKKKRRR